MNDDPHGDFSLPPESGRFPAFFEDGTAAHEGQGETIILIDRDHRISYMNEAGRDRVRVQIVQLLERLNSLEAAQVLLEFDQFQNTTLSKEVNAALSRMRERFATREAFANWNNQQRQRAQTIGGLAALLDAEEPDQRVAAIQSLGALAAQEYLPDLIVLFADEDPSVAAAARKAVHSIQDALERVPGSKPDESRGEAPEGDSE